MLGLGTKGKKSKTLSDSSSILKLLTLLICRVVMGGGKRVTPDHLEQYSMDMTFVAGTV